MRVEKLENAEILWQLRCHAECLYDFMNRCCDKILLPREWNNLKHWEQDEFRQTRRKFTKEFTNSCQALKQLQREMPHALCPEIKDDLRQAVDLALAWIDSDYNISALKAAGAEIQSFRRIVNFLDKREAANRDAKMQQDQALFLRVKEGLQSAQRLRLAP